MSPLEALLLILLVALPCHWFVLRHYARHHDPAYLRAQGIVIVRDSALQARSAPIGEYLGAPIWGTVTFKGMLYRFDHVLERRYRARIGPGELYLEPGLVYVTD